MRKLTYIILLFFVPSCLSINKQWKTIDYNAFKISIPKNWAKFKSQSLEKDVNGFTNGKDSLVFEYGKNIQEIDGYEWNNYLYKQDTINGLIAIIQIPKVEGKGLIKLSMLRANYNYKFSLIGKNINCTKTILKMFKSLVFSSSNTSINSTLSIDKFKTYSEGNGRSLFIINCAQCHFTNSLNIAPALDYELMSTRTNSWLYTYLRDRKNVIQDSLYLDRKKRFKDNECRELSEYSKEEVIQLISYLKG